MSQVAEGRSVRERPIIFSRPMVTAILAGQKTQTRRVMKPQPKPFAGGVHPSNAATHPAPYIDAYRSEPRTKANPHGMGDEWYWWTEDDRLGPSVGRCPFGQPGDRLWVREAWAVPHMYDGHKPGGVPDTARVHYLDTGTRGGLLWRSPIFMPRWASRLTLEVVSVRVERLQDITEEDARAEGVTDGGCLNCGEAEPCVCAFPTPSAREGFISLWDSINGERPGCAWGDNPFVWVVEFQRTEGAA